MEEGGKGIEGTRPLNTVDICITMQEVVKQQPQAKEQQG